MAVPKRRNTRHRRAHWKAAPADRARPRGEADDDPVPPARTLPLPQAH